MAINDQENDYDYDENVGFTIQKDVLADYIKATHHINYSGATVCLLSRNKGLETVIEALPKVIERHPEVLYIILRKTHPSVIKFEGESNRNKLKLLVKKLRVENNAHFFNEYLNKKQQLVVFRDSPWQMACKY